VQDATIGLQFKNNASANFTVNQTFERLSEPFRIRTTVAIPAGDYEYRGYTASGSIGTSRRTTGSGSITWGEFWDGRSTSIAAALGLRPNYHWSMDLNYTRNDVVLRAGAFTTDLVGSRWLYAFTPRVIVNAFLQYNADTGQVSSNIRFNWTHHPLSDVYVVYNDIRDVRRGEPLGRSVIVKLTNLFNF
jgi:hypothetical protein